MDLFNIRRNETKELFIIRKKNREYIIKKRYK